MIFGSTLRRCIQQSRSDGHCKSEQITEYCTVFNRYPVLAHTQLQVRAELELELTLLCANRKTGKD